MSGQGTPRRRHQEADAAWGIISTLISGILVWGGLGWVLDRLLHHPVLFFPIGVLVGVGSALYLVVVKTSALK